MSLIGVETKCPYCGYHSGFPMFTHNRCPGNCGQSYAAIPTNKEEALRKVTALMERVKSLPDNLA